MCAPRNPAGCDAAGPSLAIRHCLKEGQLAKQLGPERTRKILGAFVVGLVDEGVRWMTDLSLQPPDRDRAGDVSAEVVVLRLLVFTRLRALVPRT
jgi:hypothetical protein